MKRTTSLLAISAGVFLYGCSVPPVQQTPTSTTPITTAPPTIAPPTTGPLPQIAGNWQFVATSSERGAQPFGIAGGINQSSTTASGAIHIEGEPCFDPLITRNLTGTVSPDTTSLTATSADGQAITLSGAFTNSVYNVMVGHNVSIFFIGTYQVSGGCAAGDHGTVTGQYIYSIGPEYDPFPWSGTFTDSSTQQTINATGNIVENDLPDAVGSFGLTGDAKFDVACLSTGNIKQGTYPSASFMLGTSVSLEIDTDSGTLTFAGRLEPATNKISGTYAVTGSSCNQSGSAVVSIPPGCPGCWD